MKILFLCRRYLPATYGSGGIESYTQIMAEALSQRGHEVHILTQGAEEAVHRDGKLTIHTICAPKTVFRGSWRLSKLFPFDEIAYAWKITRILRKIVKEFKVDLVHSAEFNFEGLFYNLSFGKKVPTVVHVHGPMLMFMINDSWERSIKHKLCCLFEEIYLKSADQIVANSKETAKVISEYYKIDVGNIKISWNPVDWKRFQSGEKLNGEINILYVGRLEKIKGILTVSKILDRVLSEYPNASFTFIGKDNGKLEGKRLYKDIIQNRTKNKSRIHFYDWMPREKLNSFYQKCSIFIMPSLFEPFGIVALEAMSCGKPVIATKVGGPVEYINNKKDGLLVQPNHCEDLFKALKILIEDSDLRQEIGQNAKKKVQDYFTAECKAQEIEGIYNSLIEGTS